MLPEFRRRSFDQVQSCMLVIQRGVSPFQQSYHVTYRSCAKSTEKLKKFEKPTAGKKHFHN